MACGTPAPEQEQQAVTVVAKQKKPAAADFYLHAEAYENPTTALPAHWKHFYGGLKKIIREKDFKALKAQLDDAVVTSAGRGRPAFEKHWNDLAEPWALLQKDLEQEGAFDNKDESLFSIPYWVLRPCPQSDCWRLRPNTPLFSKANVEAQALDTLFVARPLDRIGKELEQKEWYQVIRPDSSRIYVKKESLESRKGTRQLAFERQGSRWCLFMWK